MDDSPNHDERLTQLGRRLGHIVAEACRLDPRPSPADGMLAMRAIVDGLRERIPAGENTTADEIVEYVALELRRRWSTTSEPRGVPISIVDPPTPSDDPTGDQIRAANDLLASMTVERRRRLLQGLHFCCTCASDTSSGSCDCPVTEPEGKGHPDGA